MKEKMTDKKCPMCGRKRVYQRDGWKECKACGWWSND